MPQQAGRVTKYDFAAAFHQQALALPCAQETARSEQGNVSFFGQLLISDVEFYAFRHFAADAIGQVSQYLGEPLRSGVAD